jgi:hypothetical protein
MHGGAVHCRKNHHDLRRKPYIESTLHAKSWRSSDPDRGILPRCGFSGRAASASSGLRRGC